MRGTPMRSGSMKSGRRDDGFTRDRGFTLTELIVALLVSMMVCGSLAVLASAASRTFRLQPEAADLLQRARAGHEQLVDELTTAGAGIAAGRDPQPLVHWIPAILPDARDPHRLTVITVPNGAPHASLEGEMTLAAGSDVVPLARDASCGSIDDTCGFAAGQHVLLFDASPAFDIATVAALVPPATSRAAPLAVQLRPGEASKIWRAADDAHLAVARVTTFSYDAARRQLRRATGDGADVPALDEVVELSFRYFADPFPPEAPRPPPGESNCLFESSGITRLPVLTPDASDDALSLTEMPLAVLTDGPFCGTPPNRFDADLYRIRRVRVRLRVQAASASLRGSDPLRFQIPGHATIAGLQIPDMVMEMDVTPRNLQVR
jgi:hypothetical protein